jgi:hypothetical protein
MDYRNAKRISNNRIDCEIDHPVYGWIPFTCDPTDVGSPFNVKELYAQIDNDPKTEAYVPPTAGELKAQLADEVRFERNQILATVVDPLVSNPLRWGGLTVEKQQEWADYRRALLDIPDQAGFPADVTWPIKPE